MVDKNLAKLVQIILYDCVTLLHGSCHLMTWSKIYTCCWSDMKMENSLMTSMKFSLCSLSCLPYKLPVMLTLCQRHGTRYPERRNCFNEFTYVVLLVMKFSETIDSLLLCCVWWDRGLLLLLLKRPVSVSLSSTGGRIEDLGFTFMRLGAAGLAVTRRPHHSVGGGMRRCRL